MFILSSIIKALKSFNVINKINETDTNSCIDAISYCTKKSEYCTETVHRAASATAPSTQSGWYTIIYDRSMRKLQKFLQKGNMVINLCNYRYCPSVDMKPMDHSKCFPPRQMDSSKKCWTCAEQNATIYTVMTGRDTQHRWRQIGCINFTLTLFERRNGILWIDTFSNPKKVQLFENIPFKKSNLLFGNFSCYLANIGEKGDPSNHESLDRQKMPEPKAVNEALNFMVDAKIQSTTRSSSEGSNQKSEASQSLRNSPRPSASSVDTTTIDKTTLEDTESSNSPSNVQLAKTYNIVDAQKLVHAMTQESNSSNYARSYQHSSESCHSKALELVELVCDSPNTSDEGLQMLLKSSHISLAASLKDLKVLFPSLQNEFQHQIYANKNWGTFSNGFDLISSKLGAKQSENYLIFFSWIILLGLINVHNKSYKTVTLLLLCFYAISLQFFGAFFGEHEEDLNVGMASLFWLTTSQTGNFIFIWVLISKYATFSIFINILHFCIYLLITFLVNRLSGNVELGMNYFGESLSIRWSMHGASCREFLGLMTGWSTGKEMRIGMNQSLVGFITSAMSWWILLCVLFVNTSSTTVIIVITKKSAEQTCSFIATATCTFFGRKNNYTKLILCVAFFISQRAEDRQWYTGSVCTTTYNTFLPTLPIMMRETQPSTKYAELVSLTETGDRAWIEHLDLPFLDPTYLWISKLTPFLKNPLEDKLNPIKKSKKSCCLNELAWAMLHGAHTCGELIKLENFYPCQSGGCLNKYGIITTQPKSSHKRFIHVKGLILHLQSSPKMFFSDSTPKVCGYTDIKQTLHNNSFVEEVCLYEDLLSVYWTTCNPCSLSHNPSGSAGGEAALQACAGLPISFASDTGGSIRTLAAFSGVFGDKPTPNIVSNHGADMQEQNYPVMESMQALGPMSCHVQDISSILQVLCGDNAHLPPLDADVFLTKCRFFYLMSHVDDGAVSPVEPMVWHATQRVVDYLEYNFGVIVKPLHIPELVDILSLHTEEMSRLSPNNSL